MLRRFRLVVFDPLFILTVSLVTAFVLALLIVLLFRRNQREFLLYYSLPPTVPFIAFTFDRAKRWHEISGWQWLIEIPIIILALLRAFVSIPRISGHAIFLTYALLTTRLRVAQLLALLVMLEVAYLKIFAWGNSTIIGGMLIGIVAGFAVRLIERPKRSVTK